MPNSRGQVSTQKHWSMDDLMDLPQDYWTDRVHELASAWCDMVYPRVAAVFRNKYDLSLGCQTEEVQHVLMLALFLHWGSEKPMTACLRVLVSTALQVWSQGRRIFWPLWSKALHLAEEWKFQNVSSEDASLMMSSIITICLDQHRMAEVFDGWDGTFDPVLKEKPTARVDEAPPETGSTGLGNSEPKQTLCSVIGVFGSDEELESLSFWRSRRGTLLNTSGYDRVQMLSSHHTLRETLEVFQGPTSMLNGHPRIEVLWRDAAVYDISNTPLGEDSELDLGLTFHRGDLGLWQLFLDQYNAAPEDRTTDVTTEKVGADSTEPAGVERSTEPDSDIQRDKSKDASVKCECSPARMFSYVSHKVGKRTTGSVLATQLTRAQNMGSFALIQVGDCLGPWYYDPGSAMTQMTPEEISKCGDSLKLISKGKVHFIFAESAVSKVVKIYKAEGLRLVNPDTGGRTDEINTYVIENADLKVYPRILGRNTLGELNVSVHHRSGTMSNDSGMTWKLWSVISEDTVVRDVGFEDRFMDKSSLEEAMADYEDGILIDPQLPLSEEELFEIRQDDMSAGNIVERHRHPEYVWSPKDFIRAEITNDTQYFIDAIITHMPRVQRQLKRSTRNFHNFSAYVGEWFRQSRKLQSLWAMVWTEATLGRPRLKADKATARRHARFERLSRPLSGGVPEKVCVRGSRSDSGAQGSLVLETPR